GSIHFQVCHPALRQLDVAARDFAGDVGRQAMLAELWILGADESPGSGAFGPTHRSGSRSSKTLIATAVFIRASGMPSHTCGPPRQPLPRPRHPSCPAVDLDHVSGPQHTASGLRPHHAGIPNSRATIAACDIIARVSTTKAAA